MQKAAPTDSSSPTKLMKVLKVNKADSGAFATASDIANKEERPLGIGSAVPYADMLQLGTECQVEGQPCLADHSGSFLTICSYKIKIFKFFNL